MSELEIYMVNSFNILKYNQCICIFTKQPNEKTMQTMTITYMILYFQIIFAIKNHAYYGSSKNNTLYRWTLLSDNITTDYYHGSYRQVDSQLPYLCANARVIHLHLLFRIPKSEDTSTLHAKEISTHYHHLDYSLCCYLLYLPISLSQRFYP